MTVGTVIGALSVVIFFAPANIAPAGVSGFAVILNNYAGTPIGLVTFVGNLPILYLAYRMLGGWRAVIWTVYVVTLYSVVVDLMGPFFPPGGISDETLLNAIFAGVVGGFGAALIYRSGATFGGTSTLARILQLKLGMPLSTTALYANLTVVFLAGAFIGWESALFSLVALVLEGMVADYVLEGPSVIRTVSIVTDHPRDVSDAIINQLRRGVSGWEVTGMYTGASHHMLFVTVSRSQVSILRQIVTDVDPTAFIVISQGHIAYGGGFKRVVSGPRRAL